MPSQRVTRFTLRPFLPLLALGITLSASVAQAQVLPGGQLRVLPLGDSITYGSRGINGGYRLPLERDLSPLVNFRFVGSITGNSIDMKYKNHEGHPGWTITDYLGETRRPTGGRFVGGSCPVANFVKSARPDVVLLMIGTNDGAIPQAEFERRYRRMLGYIYQAAPNAGVVFALTLTKDKNDNGAFIRASHAAGKKVAAEFALQGRSIIVVNPSVGFNPATMTTDGIHPSKAGYEQLSRSFLAGLTLMYPGSLLR
ncbi:hypothetical protein EON81_11165 [bacterium]|nr:MAG: hypothetical protein EON81_11165 [bacterium]